MHHPKIQSDNHTPQSDVRVNINVLKYSALMINMGPVLFIYVALCTTTHPTGTESDLVSQQHLEPRLEGGRLAVTGQRNN